MCVSRKCVHEIWLVCQNMCITKNITEIEKCAPYNFKYVDINKIIILILVFLSAPHGEYYFSIFRSSRTEFIAIIQSHDSIT